MNTVTISSKKLVSTLFAFALLGLTACSGGSNDGEQATDTTTGVNPGNGNTNSAPSLSITSPSNNASFSSNQTITLTAAASDNEDGDISGNIVWSSDLDGDLGTGASLNVSLTVGVHTITALVEDSGNLTDEESISLVIEVAEGVATVMWTAPMENTDNSVLTNLAGFKIYFGTDANNLDQSIDINDATLSSWIIENLSVDTTYYFAVTAINDQGIESDYSDVASKHISG